MNERHIYFNNKYEKNNPYFPFWVDKILNKNVLELKLRKLLMEFHN